MTQAKATKRLGRPPGKPDRGNRTARAIRRHRLDRGLGVAEFAAQIGVSVRQVHKYELGTRTPTLARTCRIARVLGVSVDNLT